MTTCLCGNPVAFESVLCPRCQALRTLELGADASEKEIKAAYHMLVKVWHPDRFPGDNPLKAAAEVKLKEVNSAYALLTARQPGGGRSQGAPAGSNNARTPGAAPDSEAATRPATSKRRPAAPQPLIGFASIAPALRLFFKLFLVALALLTARYLWIAFDVDSSTSEVQQVVGYGKDSLEKGLAAPKRRFLAAVEQDLQRLNLWSPAPASTIAPPAGKPAANPASERVAIASAPAGARQTSKTQPVTRKVYSYITVGSTRDEVLDQLGTPASSTDSKMVYGQSELYLKDNSVAGWKIDPVASPIRVKLWPESSVDPSLDSFTVGSSRDEVLVVQGTPTAFSEDRFAYGSSEVWFQNRRVVRWKSDPASIALKARVP
jgi:hypothetical protein